MPLKVGTWSNGEAIDTSRVPHEVILHGRGGCLATQTFVAANGGMFEAKYILAGKDGDDFRYELDEVEEAFPPPPPQILGFGDDRRLPMMDKYGYSANAEAEQRRKEWAEVLLAR